jgi:cell division protein ZapA
MANINIKFNNKDYLLSCDDGQEDSLKKLVSFLDKKYIELQDQLGSIGENKLLLITTIKILDDYFNLKQKVDMQKSRLDEISKKFLDMKSLAIQYKENKDSEISNLNKEIDKFKATMEESNSLYESILDKTTKSLEDIINNTESKSELQ